MTISSSTSSKMFVLLDASTVVVALVDVFDVGGILDA
eukprot:CAMPEP_0195293462 /NCGR_PEP_ID=MMETSP0707-20130614/12502_1 /TAXON_ID=33640 /ORGANISM="Asterionellopsis glacialis, Strain CCMP134" /LENGTH=36 /DNA_ID= /DNA_START= /DNA_END= /DNA_ORIENTATION=